MCFLFPLAAKFLSLLKVSGEQEIVSSLKCFADTFIGDF